MIARSMKVTRTTQAIVGVISAGVAVNAMVAMQYLGVPGQAALLFMAALSIAVGSLVVSIDVYSRSSQAVANLRSIGASSGSISRALAIAIVGYGVAGAALGAIIGGSIGSAFGSGGASASGLLVEAFSVIIASACATAGGFYLGVRMVWRS